MSVIHPAFAAALLVGIAAAQDAPPPLVRLDLVVVRIVIGGGAPGVSLQLPRVGVELGEVIGLGVGFGSEPLPAPPPIELFVTLEDELAERLRHLNEQVLSGAPARVLDEAQAAITSVLTRKKLLGDAIAR